MSLVAEPTAPVALPATTLSESQRALDALFAPVGWSAFQSEYWDRAPLYLSGDRDLFAGLADAGTVRRLIEAGVPWQFRRMPEMYLDGYQVPHTDLVRTYTDMDGREARAPNLSRIARLLAAGATVNTFGQESHFPQLAALRRNFAQAFGAEVEVALFYSQKDHQGLLPHYDCVEIFVLQISGHKRWHLSSQRVEAPVVGYGTATRFDESAPHANIDLGPGDLLYMPRGLFHQAVALSDESLHATVAVKLPMFIDLLQALAQTAPDLDAIRGYLPLGGPTAWAAARPQLLRQLADAMDLPGYGAAVESLLTTRCVA